MVNLIEGFGFKLTPGPPEAITFGFKLSRTDSSHHIFARPDIPELVNLQDVKGQAKPYQIRQFLKLVEKHNLKLEDE